MARSLRLMEFSIESGICPEFERSEGSQKVGGAGAGSRVFWK